MIFQNDINIQKELKEIKTEKLIYDYTFPQLNNDSIQKIKEFDITLLEKKVINIQLTETYCYRIKNTDEVYESFEGLLKNTSPMYNERFNQLLFEKLMKK